MSKFNCCSISQYIKHHLNSSIIDKLSSKIIYRNSNIPNSRQITGPKTIIKVLYWTLHKTSIFHSLFIQRINLYITYTIKKGEPWNILFKPFLILVASVLFGSMKKSPKHRVIWMCFKFEPIFLRIKGQSIK